ncbi:MAG TPA: segregation/condensation protein A [Coriobacteriia bacterium]
MSYRVRTDVFEGPFDLLLHLVSKQKVEITEIDISEVADQYLDHIDRMKDLDLDMASDFLLVAATLLEMKAASILPSEREPGEPDEYEDLSPEEARKLLIARLLAYKTFKNASAELAARMESEARMLPRQAGLEERFLKLMPDYLEGITLRSLGVICADLLARREVFLLEAEHVAAMPISLELHVRYVANLLGTTGRKLFSELVAAGSSAEEIVVTFLAILELYKRGEVDLRQDGLFGEIEITNVEEGA